MGTESGCGSLLVLEAAGASLFIVMDIWKFPSRLETANGNFPLGGLHLGINARDSPGDLTRRRHPEAAQSLGTLKV